MSHLRHGHNHSIVSSCVLHCQANETTAKALFTTSCTNQISWNTEGLETQLGTLPQCKTIALVVKVTTVYGSHVLFTLCGMSGQKINVTLTYCAMNQKAPCHSTNQTENVMATLSTAML